jgi:rare lipoprotein A
MKNIRSIILIVAYLALTACSSGRYQDSNDSTPTRLPSQAELKDAIARAEPYSRGGNKDYQVRGKHYQVLTSAEGFEQTGLASWYGNKFHGHLTSNGEIYDMYAMSAAHKNLPLPTYLTVTNLTNNKSVVVRVNDRGPFHQSRILDLSYSAAYKLGILKQGTAKVKITTITNFDQVTPNKVNQRNINIKSSDTLGITTPYIQVFATSKKQLAQKTAIALAKETQQQVHYPQHQGIYRILIGPIDNLATLNELLNNLKATDYPNAYPRKKPL